MELSFLFFSDKPDIKWQLVRQMGVKYAIAKLSPELTGREGIWQFASLQKAKSTFAEHGFDLIGLEGDQMDMTRIKLGLPGRDEDVEKYKAMLRNMGMLGINLLCYNFMATGWFRTHVSVPERGGATVTAYQADTAAQLPLTAYGEVSADKIWKNYTYFIREVMPIAEEAGVRMALHPDDPPVPSIQGIARIFIDAPAIRRALSLIESPSHGLTFCQGTYLTMGENIHKLALEFGNQNKIFFVHIRDIRGHAYDFRETFHDNGPTDMPEMFKLYNTLGISGPVRSDHVPSMAGEPNQNPGYEMNGNLFGIGYIKGIMDALKILVLTIILSSCASTDRSNTTTDTFPDSLDLYFLVGQSNMAGRGALEEIDTISHPAIYVLDTTDNWVLAKEPLHHDRPDCGVGPGFAFAKALLRQEVSGRIGIIPAAVGGTKIAHWHPENERGLYREAMRKTKIAMQHGTLKGILWQQGESDAHSTDPDLYKRQLIDLLVAFRKDLGDPRVPIVVGGLPDFLQYRNAVHIDLAIQEVADLLSHTTYCTPSELGHIGDSLHFNSAAQRENGIRMAEAMESLLRRQP